MLVQNISAEIQTNVDTWLYQRWNIDIAPLEVVQVADWVWEQLTKSMSDVFLAVKSLGAWWGGIYMWKSPATEHVGWIEVWYPLLWQSFQQIFEDMLVPDHWPQVTLTLNPASWYRERWNDIASVDLTAHVTKNTYDIASVVFRRGWTAIHTVPSPNPNWWNETYTEPNLVNTNVMFYVDVTDTNWWTATAWAWYNFIFPFFYWKISWGSKPVANQALLDSWSKVISPSSGTISVSFSSSNTDWIWFAIPNWSTSKTKRFINELNKWNIGTPSDLFGAEDIVSVDSPSALWTNENYKFYISNYQSEVTLPMDLLNN